ncbi:MAG TPA: hypothetical protein VFE45_17205, partial [Coriobacteriia bacterium]|nr:hypothetical protein [Coriobacteriia bacterium]
MPMLGQRGQPPVEAEQLRMLEGAATRVEERPERCDVELQTLVGAEALNEMAAVVDGGQRLLWGLSGQADHEEQVQLLAPLGQCGRKCLFDDRVTDRKLTVQFADLRVR